MVILQNCPDMVDWKMQPRFGAVHIDSIPGLVKSSIVASNSSTLL